MAKRQQTPYFLALLPFPRTLDAVWALETCQEAQRAAASPKYSFEGITDTPEGCYCVVSLLYRSFLVRDLNQRSPKWESESDTKKVIEFLFTTRFQVTLSSRGTLAVRFPSPKGWNSAELAYLHVELRNQLFHLSKNIVKTLQERDVIPGDFEYKRYATQLSAEPEGDLISRFEDVFASIHTDANAVAVSVFEQTKGVLGSSIRMLLFPFRTIVPSSLTRRWAHARKMAFLGRSLVGWYYWLVWHALPQRRSEVELRLAGRKENARAELSDIEAQSNQFLNASSGISTDLGVFLGSIGVGIAVVIGGVQFHWPGYATITGTVLVLALALKSLFGIQRNVGLLRDDAIAICQVFRWDHEIVPRGRVAAPTVEGPESTSGPDASPAPVQ